MKMNLEMFWMFYFRAKLVTRLSNKKIWITGIQTGKADTSNNIPPGYRDTSKSKDEISYYIYNQLHFEREYGDLMIWFQIMDHAKKDGLKHIIFVTDDDKRDWWWTKDKKKLGVRPELIEEIRSKSDISLFYMYSSESLMVNAKNYLRADIKDELIKQVGEISKLDRKPFTLRSSDSPQSTHGFVRQIFIKWLEEQYPSDIVEDIRGRFPSIVLVKPKTDYRIGYEITYVRNSTVAMQLRDRVYRGYYEIHENKLDEMIFVLIADLLN